jgi:thiol-disulfide isomerase/thioredoxin
MKRLLGLSLITFLCLQAPALIPCTPEQKEAIINDYDDELARHPDILPLYTGRVIACLNLGVHLDSIPQTLAELQKREGGSRMAEFLTVALANYQKDPATASKNLEAYLAIDPMAAFQIHEYPREQVISEMSTGIVLSAPTPQPSPEFKPDAAYLDHTKHRESLLRDFISRNPSDWQAAFYLILHLLADGRYKEAEPYASSLAGQRPDDGMAQAIYGMTEDLLDKAGNAQDSYLKALKIPFDKWSNPNRYQAERVGLDEELSWVMPPDGTYFIEYAWRHLASSDKYTEALNLLENYPATLNPVRAYLRWKLGDAEGAMRELKASQLDLKDNSLWATFSHRLFIAALLELNGFAGESQQMMEKALPVAGELLSHPVRQDIVEYLRDNRITSFYEQYNPVGQNTTVNILDSKLEPLDHPLVGKSLPDVEFVDLEDRAYHIQSAGNWTILEFWITDCPACIREIAELQKLRESHPNLFLLGINLAETPTKIREYQTKYGVDWESVRAGKSQAEAYKILATPTLVLVNTQGMVQAVFQGFTEAARIEEFMK